MVACERFAFSSTAGPMLDARLWRPACRPRAVVQFVHGMAEHIDRYEEFARALNAAGIAAAGHTHLGHRLLTLYHRHDNSNCRGDTPR